MRTFLYVLTALGSVIGGFFLLMALTTAESAPQEASLAAIAVAFAVLPCCFARAVEKGGNVALGDDIHIIAEHYRRLDQAGMQKQIQSIGTLGSPFRQPRSGQSNTDIDYDPKWAR